MILNYKLNNFAAFGEQVELDMQKRLGKRNESNYVSFGNHNILKSTVIYGANNSGKTNFLKSLVVLRKLINKGDLSGFDFSRYANFLNNEYKRIEFEISFLDLETRVPYTYGLEILSQGELVEYYYRDEELIYYKGIEDTENGLLNEHEVYLLENVADNSLVFSVLEKMNKSGNSFVKPFRSFLDRLWYVDFSFDDPIKQIQYLQLEKEILKNEHTRKLYNSMLTCADISLHGKEYVNNKRETNSNIENINKEYTELIEDLNRIQSLYRKYDGEIVRKVSMTYDSVGTRRFSRILIEVIAALRSDKILIIDEIDNSLHYKLVKALMNFIHKNTNSLAQFVMSTHDVKLMDSNLFRKEQINIISRTNKMIEMYSLADFASNTTVDLRPDGKFEKNYIEGKFGGLPSPDFYDALEAYEETLQKTVQAQNQ